MTLEATALPADAVSRTPEGYEVRFRLWSYRSLPLSCVEDVSISIDGRLSNRDELRVIRGDRRLKLEELGDMVDEEWFVQDPMTVLVPAEAAADVGEDVELEVRLDMRIPYIIMGPGVAMIQKTLIERKVTVQ